MKTHIVQQWHATTPFSDHDGVDCWYVFVIATIIATATMSSQDYSKWLLICLMFHLGLRPCTTRIPATLFVFVPPSPACSTYTYAS